jgi:hypothetical protein
MKKRKPAMSLGFAAIFTLTFCSGQLEAQQEDPYKKGLAEHLVAAEAALYCAGWAPHCQQQMEMFGHSAARVPYVDCSPDGPNAPSAPGCIGKEVTRYPTWIFRTERHVGILTMDELAQRTGYPAQSAQSKAGLERCRSIENADSRLACYDALVQPKSAGTAPKQKSGEFKKIKLIDIKLDSEQLIGSRVSTDGFLQVIVLLC